jgi:hypothetical protein
MPTYRPTNGKKVRAKPWFARAKVDNEHFSLGYFATKEEADAVEKIFKDYMRRQRRSPSAAVAQ